MLYNKEILKVPEAQTVISGPPRPTLVLKDLEQSVRRTNYF